MKLICIGGATLVVLVLAVACAPSAVGPPGPAGPQGPAGPPGPAEPAYSPELFNDCRETFSHFSESTLRRIVAANWDVTDLGELTDDDVRGIVTMACFGIASGADLPWGDLLTN